MRTEVHAPGHSILPADPRRNSNGYTFQYPATYLENADLPAISLTLPRQAAPFRSQILFPFFFGLLAERSEEMQGEIWKYDGSYEGNGRLIRKHAPTYKVDLERFVRLVLFNYLVHNRDPHLKNFTLTRNGTKGSYFFSPRQRCNSFSDRSLTTD